MASATGHGAIRHAIDVDKLSKYLESQIDIALPIQVKQFGFGQSNPTYYIVAAEDFISCATNSNKRYVVRKKPPGELVSKNAHDVAREYKVQKALGNSPNVPVAKMFCLCEDASIIGTPFYLMDYVEGRIFSDPAMQEVKSTQERKELWYAAVRNLAALHNADYKSVGLGDFGPQTEFYPRQAKSLAKVSRAQAVVKHTKTGKPVGEIEGLDKMVAWYTKNCPRGELVVTHGDYKIDNIVYHPTEAKVIAALDWELSTLGHPLTDLAHLLIPFYAARGDEEHGSNGMAEANKAALPPMEDLVDLYCKERGNGYKLDPKTWVAAQSFAFYRFGVICQGIAARAAAGNASSEKASTYGQLYPTIIAEAKRFIEQADTQFGTGAKL